MKAALLGLIAISGLATAQEWRKAEELSVQDQIAVLQRDLAAERAALAELEKRYTRQHPDVMRALWGIARIEGQLKQLDLVEPEIDDEPE